MKKVLLASTVLAMSATVAAAEVSTTGSARMGVYSDGTDSFFSSRVRIVFTGSGETDSGLSFGASVRADQVGGNGANKVLAPDGTTDVDDDPDQVTLGNTGQTNADSTVFVSGAFGKVTMGDTGNAADSLVGQVSGVGYGPGSLDGAADVKFLDTISKTGVSYEYAMDSITFAVGTGQVDAASEYVSAAVKYAGDAFTVAVGYESDADNTRTSALVSTTVGSATVKAKVADASEADETGYAVSVDYAMAPVTVTAFLSHDFSDATDDNTGLGVSYDLGGGAAVKAGVGSVNGESVYDAGISLSF